jgi:hypothetical protein
LPQSAPKPFVGSAHSGYPINSDALEKRLPFYELFEIAKIFARQLSKRRRLKGRPQFYRNLSSVPRERLKQDDTLRTGATACLPGYSALWHSQYNL